MIRKDIKKIMMEYFFVNPSIRARVREIERKLDLPIPSVIRYCKELEHEHILTTECIGKSVFYRTDRTDKNFLLNKKLYNLKALYLSGLIDYLIDRLSNPTIILFGSYSKGEDVEESDIDMFIETPSKKDCNFSTYEERLHRKIQVFRKTSIEDISNPHLANNIINGIILNGFIEVFK